MQNGFQPQDTIHRDISVNDSMKRLMTRMDDPVLWQEAQDRVLLYLKKLGLPAILSLEIADKALRQAVDDLQTDGSDLPVQLAMRALHRIIVNNINVMNNSAYKEYPNIYRHRYRENFAVHGGSSTEFNTIFEPSASPPINRGSMMIKKL